MKFIFILAIALFFTFVALAANAQDAKVSEASVSIADCKRIVKNDATYKPGVDAHGKSVVGANVPTDGAALKLPDEIVVDFGFDFAGRYGFDATGLHTATAGILTIEYDLALGGLTVNGKRLNKTDSRAATKACTMLLRDAAGGQ